MQLSSKVNRFALIAATGAYTVQNSPYNESEYHTASVYSLERFLDTQLKNKNIKLQNLSPMAYNTGVIEKIVRLYKNIIAAVESCSEFTDEAQLIIEANALANMTFLSEGDKPIPSMSKKDALECIQEYKAELFINIDNETIYELYSQFFDAARLALQHQYEWLQYKNTPHTHFAIVNGYHRTGDSAEITFCNLVPCPKSGLSEDALIDHLIKHKEVDPAAQKAHLNDNEYWTNHEECVCGITKYDTVISKDNQTVNDIYKYMPNIIQR